MRRLTDECRLCGKPKLSMILELGNHPIAHDFLDSSEQEEYLHPVEFCFCNNCGLLQLINPIPPEMLYANYVTLSSWKHQPHIPELIEMIEEKTTIIKTSKILEVGSNDGIFLKALGEKGYKNLVGIEPACDAQESARQKGVKTIPAYFNRKTAEDFVKNYGKCDFFIARQMLEHIEDIKEFKESMRIVLEVGAFVLFEVPNFQCCLDNFDYTIWEEHANYFILETLNYFLLKAGIKIIHSETILFSGEALIVVGEYIGDSAHFLSFDYMGKLKDKVFNYQDQWLKFRSEFIQYLKNHKQKGDKIAVYGAGSRLCSLINFIGLGPYIEFVVDDQPQKQGKYLPGSKLSILPSDELNEKSIDICLLAVNTECEDKVMAKHKDFKKRGGSFISVLPPSDRLPAFWNQILASR
ncbi:MAG: class I SAM-dependent methyltransferase [Candidatus Omnitrophota bacterium]